MGKICKIITIVLLLVFMRESSYSQIKLNTITINSTAELKEFFSYTPDRIPLVCAHRGGDRVGYPENSIATFENVLSRMHAFFEVDPRLTKDGVIVAFHDETLERTTNGTGKLADYTWEELKQLKLKDAEGNITPYGIHTLEEVLKWAKGKTILILDKKDVPLNSLLALIEANQAESYLLISAFSINDAKYYYSRNPNLMFEAVIETEAEMNAYEASNIPWENIVAFTRRTDTSNDGVPENVNTLLNQKLRQKGVMCMLSTMKYQDKEKNRDVRIAGYQDLVANHGIDIILTDRASELSTALKGFIPAVSSKSKFFQQKIVDSDYSQAFTDIDGNVYNTVTIGNQVWTSSNLRVTKYRNGDLISTGLTNTAWAATTAGAYTVYPFADAGEANEATVKDKYGLLYNAYAINDPRNIAPLGWRVATDNDWKELEKYSGMLDDALNLNADWRNTDGEGQKLKSEEGWTWDNKAGTDKYGFYALPAGYRAATGAYGQVQTRAYFWTATTSAKATPSNWRRILEYNKVSIHRVDISRNEGYPVRLVKDISVTPVKLTSFLAIPYGNKVRLTWATASEHNNAYFEIEHSVDGERYLSMAKLVGSGTINTPKTYSHTDYAPSSGTNYYRLKQIDYNGASVYCGIQAVNFKLGGKLIWVYPNPSSAQLHIKSESNIKGPVSVKLLDIRGKLIHNETVSALNMQNGHQLHFVHRPVAGQYILEVKNENIKETIKITIK